MSKTPKKSSPSARIQHITKWCSDTYADAAKRCADATARGDLLGRDVASAEASLMSALYLLLQGADHA